MSPEAAGLPPGGGLRRVPGLRREEIAVLAGVSVDYYRRLEQGREHRPSTAVLDALARALDLDEDARAHLFRLAGVQPPLLRARPARRVSPELLRLLGSWPHTPAVVIDRTLDVLALNELASALYRDFDSVDNFARMTFVDPVGREFFVEYERAAQSCVANLRIAQSDDSLDAAVAELVAELSAASALFARLWAGHEVRGKTRAAKRFQHRAVGVLELDFQAFEVRGAPGQELVVYSAAPGSESAQKLALLGSLGATDRAARR